MLHEKKGVPKQVASIFGRRGSMRAEASVPRSIGNGRGMHGLSEFFISAHSNTQYRGQARG